MSHVSLFIYYRHRSQTGMGLFQLKSRHLQVNSFLEAPGDNTSCFSLLPEAAFIPWPKANSDWSSLPESHLSSSDFRPLSTRPCDYTVLTRIVQDTSWFESWSVPFILLENLPSFSYATTESQALGTSVIQKGSCSASRTLQFCFETKQNIHFWKHWKAQSQMTFSYKVTKTWVPPLIFWNFLLRK